MGDPTSPPLRPEVLIAAFVDAAVEFLVVGGIAAQSYGATRQTNDLDLCVRWTPENLARVAAALERLDARLRIEGLDEPQELPRIDAEFIERIELSTWRTRGGDVDILMNLPAPGSYRFFDELTARARWASLAGHRVQLASLDDIIVSKRTVDRPPDREALPELEILAERSPLPQLDEGPAPRAGRPRQLPALDHASDEPPTHEQDRGELPALDEDHRSRRRTEPDPSCRPDPGHDAPGLW